MHTTKNYYVYQEDAGTEDAKQITEDEGNGDF